jgi:transcriptional regulator with XRE-family HTH domain
MKPRGKGRPVSPKKFQDVFELKNTGLSTREVARRLDLAYSTVYWRLKGRAKSPKVDRINTISIELWINDKLILSRSCYLRDKGKIIKSMKERYKYALVRNNWQIFQVHQSFMNHCLFRPIRLAA